MKRVLYLSALLILIVSLALFQTSAVGQTAAKVPAAAGLDQHRTMVNTYCVGCHNNRAKIDSLALDNLDLQATTENAEI